MSGVAAAISILLFILEMLVWNEVNSVLPFEVDAVVHLIVIIAAAIVSLAVFFQLNHQRI